jgi:hypothetical protein
LEHLVFDGLQFKLPGQEFDPSKPFSYCRLCGEVFQHPEKTRRQAWSWHHASANHMAVEHKLLADSGLWLTVQATYKLAPLGVVVPTDFQKAAAISPELGEEYKRAGLEAPRYRSDVG